VYNGGGGRAAIIAGGALAFTGFESLVFAMVGVGLLVTGFVMLRAPMMLRRRRARQAVHDEP